MTQEVSGLPQTTLLEAIQSGQIQDPGVLYWNEWEKWRSHGGGLRPTMAADGKTTDNAFESQLWKNTMTSLHGAEWRTALVERDVPPQGSAPRPEPAAPASAEGSAPVAGAPSGAPDAAPADPALQAAAFQTPRRADGERPVKDSPGSNADGRVSPGSGVKTPSSWRSDNPGTPTGIRDKVLTEFDPYKESVDKYINRTTRQAVFLANMGEPLDAGVLDVCHYIAGFTNRLHEEARDDEVRKLRIVSRELGFEMLDIDNSTQ